MLLVEMKKNLTVTVRGEDNVWIDLLQILPQLNMIVDLTINRQSSLLGVVGDWLSPRQKSIDSKSLMSEVTVLEASDSIPVRSSVSQQLGQGEKIRSQVSIGVLRRSKQSQYSTHSNWSVKTAGR